MSGTSSSSSVLSQKHVDPKILEKKLPEWILFEKILADAEKLGRIHFLGTTTNQKNSLPLVALSFGSQDPQAPVLGLFGGIHGLERIGSQVALSLLQSFTEMLLWDEMLQSSLQKIRILFFPMINPLGIMERTRSNPNGVDLMRNSPVEADLNATPFIGGQRISPKIPWFRGTGKIEPEAQAVIDFCRKEFFQSQAVITVDFHSGFGLQDQIWFPYAKTSKPFPHLPELYALAQSFQRTHPHHFYKIEPQALHYTTHGDLWDYIYDEFQRENSKPYLALALEMGSWMWVRKNPLQIFSSLGVFNPIKPHRQKRTLRRHMTLFDFLIRSTVSSTTWADLRPEQRNKFQERGLAQWYRGQHA